MAWVTEEFLETWRSGKYVGENTPKAVVQVQLGHWVRGWFKNGQVFAGVTVHFPPVRASIWGEGGYGGEDANEGYWSAIWVPSTPWYDLPNLSSIKRTKDFQAKGVQVVEVIVDAMDYVEKTGALGDAYHAIQPGWLAPGRSYISPQRPAQPWQQSAELGPWAPEGGQPRISDSVAMRVWQGFGDPETVDGQQPPLDGGNNGAWTFHGMIDDVDVDGDPNQITITARNGKLLTDQRLFRASKSVQINDPITFYDTEAAGKESPVGWHAKATSHLDDDHKPKNVLDRAKGEDWNPDALGYKSLWESATNITDTDLEWIEIRLDQGRYDEFFMVADLGQMAYVGVYAKPIVHWEKDPSDSRKLLKHTSPALMDGVPQPEGWIDVGKGNAPGSNGGWPYVLAFNVGSTLPYVSRGDSGRRCIDQPTFDDHNFQLGKGSRLRIGLIRRGTADKAKVSSLKGLRRHGVQKEIEQGRFILVDDATEIIKVVLRWAGFKEWEVEDARVRLSDGQNLPGSGIGAQGTSGRLAFDRSKPMMDIIDQLAQQLGWIFFIADPTDGNSFGVPTFRRDASRVQENSYVVAEATQDTMLTGVKYKRSDEARPYIIRVRGKEATARGGGVPLGGDKDSRLQATYLPPWAFGSRAGGVLRHIVYTAQGLVTYAQCLYGAMVIAINAALEMHTATIELPGHPIVELDDQVSVIDEASGVNSRLWVVKSEDEMQLGENAAWKLSLEGSLLDTQDMQDVIAEITGEQPLHYGSDGKTYVLEKINWNHVVNPNTGHVSRYVEPVVHREVTKRLR